MRGRRFDVAAIAWAALVTAVFVVSYVAPHAAGKLG